MAMNYWLSLPFATTYRFIKHYPTIEELRTKIIHHAFKNNIVIIGNGDELNMENLMANRRITRKKRSLSPRRSVSASAAAKRLKTVPSAAPIAQMLVHSPVAEQPITQGLVHAQAQAQQPILLQEAQAQQPMERHANAADSASATAIAPPSAHLPNVTNTLVLNGLVIEVDRDTFMVNATMMCKAAGKKYFEYARHDKGKLYIKALEAKTGIPAFDLIQSKPGHNGGTMVHRLVAYGVAQWCDENIAAQFVIWIDQLLLTGRVELGKEMNVQQLEDAWKRINEEVQAKASADVKAEQDRCREIILQRNELEQQLETIQEAHGVARQHKKALKAIKVREDLEAAIQYQARATAPTIATYKEGDNVLYLARIDGTKFKYGQTKNVGRRFDTHKRSGVYPTFEPIGVLPCANAVASEDKVRAYVKKNKLGVEYGTQREVVVLESVDALQRMMKTMNKCTNSPSTQPANEGTKVLLQRIKAEMKAKKIDAGVDVKIKRMDVEIKRMDVEIKRMDDEIKPIDVEIRRMDVEIKRMDVDLEMETMKLKMIADGKITFDQYLSLNKINIY